MNPEIKERWINALTSGKYNQGTHHLRQKDDTFCCLGVLCDLYVKEGLGEWEDIGGEWQINGSDGYLPNEVRKWAGVIDSNGGWTRDGLSLTYLNDSGKTFAEIAQIIEEYL